MKRQRTNAGESRKRSRSAISSQANNQDPVTKPDGKTFAQFILPSGPSRVDCLPLTFRLNCVKGPGQCSRDYHVSPVQGRGVGFCNNCRASKGATPEKKTPKKPSALSRHGRSGRSGGKAAKQKVRVDSRPKTNERGHWFLNEDGSVNIGDDIDSAGTLINNDYDDTTSIQWSNWANTAASQAHTISKEKDGMDFRTT